MIMSVFITQQGDTRTFLTIVRIMFTVVALGPVTC